MNLTRDKSVLTKGEIEELSSIKNFPVFIGASEDDFNTDIFGDLTFDICKETGIIQLRNLIDPTIVYSKFHSESIGSIWENHHNLLSKIIRKYSTRSKILEIGGSDSRLALKSIDDSVINDWTIIEPNLKTKYSHEKLHYIESFFDKNMSFAYYDMIVHSHVFEHMTDPLEFLETISYCLPESNYHIFSVPNLYAYLKNKFVNTINFEHTLFLTESIIDVLLSKFNFEIIEKCYYMEHSIIYVCRKNSQITVENFPNKYIEYKQLYLDFIDYYKSFVKNLNKELENTNKNIYLFGGHVFSQYLIALGLDTSKIICILDNSKLKRGKRLYGTNLNIKMPEEVNLNENSLVILKVGQYRDEIKNQLLNINKDIQFYE